MSLRHPQRSTVSRGRGLAAAASLAATALLVSTAGTASAATTTKVTTVLITTHTSTLGTYLTNKAGRAMYLWAADPKGKSVCTALCAKYWPPVTGSPQAGGAVKQAGLSTLTRADGTRQVTYHGHALYYFSFDKKALSAVGQGSDGFDAKWWVVSAAGTAVTKPAVVVALAKDSLGAHLTDESGRTVYLWEADPKGKSECAALCTKYWPPVTGAPQASAGVVQAGLGTLTRADGTKQVTYFGHALYYFAEDTKSGDTNGQGSNGFDAKWWVVSPGGHAITTS